MYTYTHARTHAHTHTHTHTHTHQKAAKPSENKNTLPTVLTSYAPVWIICLAHTIIQI